MRSSYSTPISTSAVRSFPEAGNKNSELLLRYAAATATTWIALAGAQLIIPTQVALILAFLAFLGVPVSLYLRRTDMRVGKFYLSPRVWNAITVIGSGIVGTLFLLPTISDMLMIWNSEPASFWLRFGGGDSLSLLMQAFLVFAAMRSFAIITDKDATLTTIPSFSVLLLLIPVHKGIEVVCYFLAWTFVATILFALDHRSELSSGVIARVPAPVPGQDVRLAARSLLTVLGVALVVSVGVSFYLTSRNPEDRSEAETAITSLAARLTQFALSLPDGSVNSGPERQIDFSSGPNLPSRAELWRGMASTIDRRVLHPDYWRLFSLSVYNGSSWSQASGPGRQKSVKKTTIDIIPREYWYPFVPANGPTGASPSTNNGGRREGGFGGGFQSTPERNLGRDSFRRDGQGLNSDFRGFAPRGGMFGFGGARPDQGAPLPGGGPSREQFAGGARSVPPVPGGWGSPPPIATDPVKGYPGIFSRKDDGFDLGNFSTASDQYGAPTTLVRVFVRAQNANLGFVPMLPSPDTLYLRFSDQNEVRVSPDGAADLGVMQPNGRAYFTGFVPRLREYGFRMGSPPTNVVPASSKAPKLATSERTINLQLPNTVSKRTRDLGASVLKDAQKYESNYSRAQRLAQAIQENAVYTLRPPAVPEGRDATDFFLFDGNKRGYCTYFAGALTVLCRTQNIPARVVSGFASPDYTEMGEAIIREANAHAWTEVWVENWGWAIVDATPSDDRGDNSPTWIESWSDWFGSTLDSVLRSTRTQWPLVTASVVTLVLLIVRWKRRKVTRIRRKGIHPTELERREIVAQYERMSQLLARRFRPRANWETPDEWLVAAEVALPNLPVEALREMTRLYLQAQFSPRPMAETAHTEAKDAVRDVRNFQWRRKTA